MVTPMTGATDPGSRRDNLGGNSACVCWKVCVCGGGGGGIFN